MVQTLIEMFTDCFLYCGLYSGNNAWRVCLGLLGKHPADKTNSPSINLSQKAYNVEFSV